MKEDKQCNIYDLVGNCVEWLTTTYERQDFPSVFKGGTAHEYYIMEGQDSAYNANLYRTYTANTKHEDIGFRTVFIFIINKKTVT